MNNYTWSIALCPSGKITEIKNGLVPLTTTLPPCSSDDLPSWVHVIDYAAYADALKMLDEMAADLDYYSKHNHLLKTTAPNFAAETLDKYRKFKERL